MVQSKFNKLFVNRRSFLKKFLSYSCISALVLFPYCQKITNFGYKLFLKNFCSMGTFGRIGVLSKDDSILFFLEKIIEKISYLEKMFTRFSLLSEIGKLNFYRSNVFISKETSDILNLCILMQKKTANYFNVALSPSLDNINVDSNFKIFASKTNVLKVVDSIASITSDNFNIDLGGVGKGYIIQEVMNYMIEVGIQHAFIEIGGDLKVYGGLPDGSFWQIFLDNNRGGRKSLFLHTGSVSTSGYFSKHFNSFLRFVKIVDPTTSLFRNYYKRISVIGSDLSICDSLSTACWNVPIIKLQDFLHSFNKYTFDIDY